MKITKFIGMILLCLIGLNSFAQLTKTSFEVSGKCLECKKRIENSLKVLGVTSADWNVNSQILSVSYDPKAIKLNKLQKLISNAGHDTPKFRADQDVYNSLPACCKYERMTYSKSKNEGSANDMPGMPDMSGHSGHH
ncbi:copper chaperone CopZ [Arcticibacter tournemirensis]|uniref:Cation transporter n=1 Tax=Arcticibacter tournemirensis TaxID=699437 RepID=A0A5M9GR19_9SPHI|nr:heavy-metal-associated domain-containing protein [Arcticibacter tournemirensis]KAA8476259.1 cation transporter [Arcticibacter tournemirensis]TQM49533.1 copper chaperone CopZ [Arcticibacter tournemirensis]